ncbi:flagellar hook capping FlgD N-terminal domain-containing protein [Exiguobacterium antarcticum]|uniref:Flagellar hook capping FlgD N-terminal domain-containing protein n=1 Tax=Exiguobacterium antarcticum TaxID=132920 RepID=A0ABT6QYU0_9BACL|nr:flagellar hook capping FlgD N-terminal domain-containing protein [Exiguobacterium antarcticum]AFS70831.1 Flagellar hook capping protein - N-terminal region [Exiguobacterium antarcticum B7]MDI3233856.1 flagellar hook capping FlgD N-terminal domain-containing protein [Exiguobacterium antarcticum]
MTESIKNEVSSYQLPDKTKVPSSNTMDKDMFMKILIAQLSNQDPTAPMEDKEFISQMAQFSSLEQMQAIGKGMDTMMLNQHAGALLTYSNLIGKAVSYEGETTTTDPTGAEVSSTVKETANVLSVKRDGVDVVAELSNGKSVSVYELTEIKTKEEK